MNDKERLQLEEELLMTCSKAQAINKYIDELEESSKLSELWCKSQQENARLKENNMSMQEEMARTWKKADLYKEVIEEVKDRITIKLGRYINEKDYVIDDVALDELLQILDKVKG